MSAVVGVEAHFSPDFDVTWGTAALRIGNELVNPTTGFRSPFARLEKLVIDGALAKLPKPIRIDKRHEGQPLVLIAVNTASKFFTTLEADKGRHGGFLGKAEAEGMIFYVAKSPETLRIYSREVTSRILKQVLAKEHEPANPELVRVGLSLDPSQPYLNALRVYLATDPSDALERLARSCTRGHKGSQAFDEMLNALRSKDKTHVLHYEKGVAEGGGLDVNHAASICKNLTTVIRSLARPLRKDFRFLPQVPPPRLAELRAASARLEFISDVSDRPLGERVARYLEIRALEKALQGDVPEDLLDDPAFDDALESVIHPTPDTCLRQKPFERDEEEPVSVDVQPEGEITEHFLTVIGVMTGVLGEAGKIEVRIFPGPRGSHLLSAVDDGLGNEPLGVDFIEGKGVQLHQLVLLNLRHVSDAQGRERHYLQGMRLLRSHADAAITAVPSSVVRGAFRLVHPITVRERAERVSIGEHTMGIAMKATHARAHEWLREYQKTALDLELTDTRREWIATARPPSPSALARVLVALWRLGGEAAANDVAEEVSRRFATIARVNNTRREVIRHADLLEFSDDQKTVRLLERGRLYVDAYRQAGGDMGEEKDGERMVGAARDGR